MPQSVCVSVLGSCVTRDAFADVTCPDFELDGYAARTSLASLACQPHVDPAILKAITSSFQRRMVGDDMRKSFWAMVEQMRARWLILDLIDDRFDLGLFADGGANTLSAEYKKVSRLSDPPIARLIPARSTRYIELWEQGFERLSAMAQQRGIKIVVNCVYYVPLANGTPAENDAVAAVNTYLESRYAYMSGVEKITYDPGQIEADPHHKWGATHFHYTQRTYEAFMAKLRMIVTAPDTQAVL